MRDTTNLFMLALLGVVALHWLVSKMRSKNLARIEEMRIAEKAEEDRLDRVIAGYFKPVPLNGLLIERDVKWGSVRTLYSCNSCGAPLKGATLCGICASKKPVSS